MFLTVIFALTLVQVFDSAAAAVIATAAGSEPASYRKSALVGAVIGVAFAIARFYLVSFISAVAFFIFSLLPTAMATIFFGILPTTTLATLSGAVVAALDGRSSLTIRKGAIVGGGFGLLIGIANPTVTFGLSATAIPYIIAEGLDKPTGLIFALMNPAVGVVVDIALAVIAFRFVRSRIARSAPPEPA